MPKEELGSPQQRQRLTLPTCGGIQTKDDMGCGGPLKALVPAHNRLEASEWYCSRVRGCHRSYKMEPKHIEFALTKGLVPQQFQ